MPDARTWRLLDTPPAPGAWNMGADAALVESVREGGLPTLRFYRWSPACLSLGRNQPARGEYDTVALQQRGVGVVRRPTGGRAVFHDRELTYSVIVREGVLGSPRQSYAAINRALAAGLRILGVPAELQPRGAMRAPSPSLAPCFQNPAEGELVAAGRKLAGSAQHRERGVILQHGSLLLDGDQSEAGSFLLAPPPDDDLQPPACLARFCDPLPTWEVLTGALISGWRATTSVTLTPGELTPGEQARAAEIAKQRFADPAWTWQR